MTTIAADILKHAQDVPHEQYQKDRHGWLSSGQLRTFRESPLLFKQQLDGDAKRPESPALRFGVMAHTLILEGGVAFGRQYGLGWPVNPKTGEPYGAGTKAVAEAQAKAGRSLVHPDDMDLLERMEEGVRRSADATRLLDAPGRAEMTFRVELPLMGYGAAMPCQVRPDWLKLDESPAIVDLKTTDSLAGFKSSARRFGYLHQLAFYRTVVAHATGHRLPCFIVAVEKKPPHAAAVFRPAPAAHPDGDDASDMLMTATLENDEAMSRLAACTDDDTWPTGYEGVHDLYLD